MGGLTVLRDGRRGLIDRGQKVDEEWIDAMPSQKEIKVRAPVKKRGPFRQKKHRERPQSLGISRGQNSVATLV